MKLKINDNFCFSKKVKVKNGTFNLYYVKALKNKKSKKCLFFIPGLNGNGITINYWNFPKIINEWNIFSVDMRAQGDDINKSSRFFKTYLKDIHEIIQHLKLEFKMEEIILLGESWGGALCNLYAKYYNDVSGYMTWNIPYEIVDVSNEKGKEKFLKSLKMIITFLTNINTYDTGAFVDDLTNDKVLIKVIKFLARKKVSNRVIISAWRSFKKSWKYLLKNHQNINFKYIQSNDDIMKSPLIVEKLRTKTDKVIIFQEGTHILTFDKFYQDKLFDEIHNFITKR